MNTYLLIILGICAVTSLVLSIISLTKCYDDFDDFDDDMLSPENCNHSPIANKGEKAVEQCEKTMKVLSTNVNSQYQGLSANRGLTLPGGPDGGSFGNPNIINPDYIRYYDQAEENEEN
jgi:hypothetical protein